MFSERDNDFMKLALDEAHLALFANDYPVGAVLTVKGVLWGTARNSLFSEERTVAHAEHALIARYSPQLRKHVREEPESEVCLYTTLEPCLMCLGIAVMHRVSRIVIACPDPVGGATMLDQTQLGSVYLKWWPSIEIGLYKEKSCDLIIEFLKNERLASWREMLAAFGRMRLNWCKEAVHV
jgi:tRNA(adenine34) deaminase